MRASSSAFALASAAAFSAAARAAAAAAASRAASAAAANLAVSAAAAAASLASNSALVVVAESAVVDSLKPIKFCARIRIVYIARPNSDMIVIGDVVLLIAVKVSPLREY